MGRPSKDEARKTREDILSAALDLFAEQGFAGTSVRQIAQAVGVAESALYYHFRSGK
jgi:AcrR family transcriptional regulator